MLNDGTQNSGKYTTLLKSHLLPYMAWWTPLRYMANEDIECYEIDLSKDLILRKSNRGEESWKFRSQKAEGHA